MPNIFTSNKKRFFGWLFVISLLVFFAANMFAYVLSTDPVDTGSLTGPKPASEVSNIAVVVSLVSLLTSITSLFGFLSTTLLAWRKEKRETISSELEIKKKEIELEKLKLELERSKSVTKDEET